jgi:hypothetical protein
LKTHVYIPLKKRSVNENQTFGGKIGFLGGEKEMWGVGREIFMTRYILKIHQSRVVDPITSNTSF